MAIYLPYDELPECCKNCINRDYDSLGDYQPTYNYCLKNLVLPTKKKTCKKQKRIKTNGKSLIYIV